ncbi:hypothetical protein SEA_SCOOBYDOOBYDOO_97 [Mycobacterium phage ScoobyDoobyDoo]|nr:hypothetical protein SEA_SCOOBYDOOBYDOO_97 [Mycobacterium phage ScoobyDoobyDoo]
MRIQSHREQYEALSPWLRTALDVHPDAVAPGQPGAGNQPVLPKPQAQPAPESQPWMSADWRNAEDYGAFHSGSRPPMSSDVPHPADVLGKRHEAPRYRTRDVLDKNGNPVPHPTKEGETLKEKYEIPSWAEQARQSKDPVNDPWGMLNDSDHTFEDLVQNHMSHHMNMNPEQEFQGRVWYRAAHDSTKDVAHKTLGDHEQTVAVDSALSPVKDWDLNNEQMIHYMTNYQGQEGYRTKPKGPEGPENDPNNRFRVKAPDSQNDKAHRILNAPPGSMNREDYLKLLSGPKTSSFFNNILDPTPLREPRPGHPDDEGFYQHQINPHTGEPDWRMGDQDVTVDTHHARVQTIPHGADLSQVGYKTPDYFSDSLKVGGKEIHPGYDLHARASAEATRRLNAMEQDPNRHLLPKQAQAGPWVKFKNDVVQAGVSPSMPEPGTPPKSFNPDKPGTRRGPYEGEPDQPRYQRDAGDEFWVHPDQPDPNLRQSPNWNNRNPAWLRGSSRRLGFVEEWIAQNFPHRMGPVDPSGPDPDLQGVASAHLGSFHYADEFDDLMSGQSFAHGLGHGPHDNPWRGPEAESLRHGCQYCNAAPGEPHDPRCPTNHTDSPADWAKDTKAVGGPALYEPGPEHDPMKRLNSVQSLLASVDDLLGFRKGAPFAGYEDFDACVRANQDKDDPEAYCGKIKHQVEGRKLASDYEPIAIHPEPDKIHPDWGGGEPDVEHRGYWRHRPLDMEVMSDWGDENGNISYALNHEGDTLDVAQDPHEFLSRSPQEIASLYGIGHHDEEY